MAAPVPIDMRVFHALSKSPLAMDVYTWLTYRMFVLRRSGRSSASRAVGRFEIAVWSRLPGHRSGLRDFKKRFRLRLKEVLLFYPAAQGHIQETPVGLALTPCELHISTPTGPSCRVWPRLDRLTPARPGPGFRAAHRALFQALTPSGFNPFRHAVPAALRVMLMATPRRAGHRAGVTSAGREITPAFGDRAADLVRFGCHHAPAEQARSVEKPCGYRELSTCNLSRAQKARPPRACRRFWKMSTCNLSRANVQSVLP